MQTYAKTSTKKKCQIKIYLLKKNSQNTPRNSNNNVAVHSNIAYKKKKRKKCCKTFL